MERLTMESDKGGLAFTFDLDVTCEREEMLKIVKLGNSLKSYEDTGLSPDICKNYKLFEDELISNDITFKELLSYIDKLKCAKSCKVSDEWIPCSERLPNKQECEQSDGEFLCFTKYGGIQVYSYSENLYKLDEYDFAYMKKDKAKNGFYDYDTEYGYMKVDIVAWMLLPAKYKENI